MNQGHPDNLRRETAGRSEFGPPIGQLVKPRRSRVRGFGGLAVALVAAIATVSTGAGVPSYTVDWQTIAAGGGRIAAGEYAIDATIGQGVTGIADSCEFTLVGGYWSVMVIDFGDGAEADISGDGTVDGADLGLLLAAWGPCDGCAADLNCDGVVDGADLGLLLAAWMG